MRFLRNSISYAVSTLGVGAPLAASFWWGLSAPWTVAFLLLAWAYCIFLVLKAVAPGLHDDRMGDVWLGQGTVDSIRAGSTEKISVTLRVGNHTRKLTTGEAAIGQVTEGDSVIFACMRTTGEIVRIVSIDMSTPGRVVSVEASPGTRSPSFPATSGES